MSCNFRQTFTSTLFKARQTLVLPPIKEVNDKCEVCKNKKECQNSWDRWADQVFYGEIGPDAYAMCEYLTRIVPKSREVYDSTEYFKTTSKKNVLSARLSRMKFWEDARFGFCSKHFKGTYYSYTSARVAQDRNQGVSAERCL